ncbi:unnamed protein product [Rotaria sordida]|uniref:Uncharacterized protein n=1 Tax=Rotaria sordida TaxID=392033 RepID=A0A815DZV6_9BILA|nr:unnamed protein product [Rotaria sordida]
MNTGQMDNSQERDTAPDTTSDDRDDRGHDGFRPGAGRKRKQSAASIQIMAKLTQWIDELKWSHQDIQSSYRDNVTALLVIFNIILENVNLIQTAAIVKAGFYLGRRYSTLDTLVSHWNKYKEVYVGSGFRGGSVDQRSTDLFTTLPYFIITTIMNRHAAGVTTTVKDIQQQLLIHMLSYGLLKDATNLTQDPNRLKRIGQFLIKYASALKLEKKKEAVICYMDESYVTTGHHSHYGWYLDHEDKDIRTGAGVGKRFILVHAITNDGLLHKTGNSNNKTISAKLIYEAKHPLGDYHSNMNGHNFRL